MQQIIFYDNINLGQEKNDNLLVLLVMKLSYSDNFLL